MSGAPAAGVGEEMVTGPLPPPLTRWQKVRRLVSEKMTYALGDQVVFSLGNLAVFALISRHCTKWEFGVYFLTQRATDVMTQLCNVFFWAPFVFNVPSTPEGERPRYLGSIAVHQVVAIVVFAGLCFGAAVWARTPARGLYYGVFAPLVWTAGPVVFREFTRRMYFAEMRLKEAFWTDVATNALQVAGVVWLAWRGRLTVLSALEALAFGAGVVCVWWMVREAGRIAFGARAIVADLLRNFKLGRWFFGSNMVFTVSSQCNPWVLGAMLGAGPVADYGICEQVVNIPRVALTSMQNVMGPMMAREMQQGGKPALRTFVARLDRALLWSSLLFAAGTVMLGKPVAHLLYHRFPAGGESVLVLLALNFVAFAAPLAQTYGLTALDRAGLTFYANAAGLVAQLAVTLWLVHAFQVQGAAAAMLVGSVVVAAVRFVFFRREIA